MSVIIGMCGGSGAGKTTLAERIKEILKEDVTLIQLDQYCCDQSHLSIEERANVNYDIPQSYDGALLYEHIIALQNNKSINRPCYSFNEHIRTKETVKINPAKIIIIEGIMAFAYDNVFSQYDMRIFVDAKEETRFERRKRRDMVERGRSEESVIKQFYGSVKPMHDIYIEPYKHKVDYLFDNNGNNGLDEKQVSDLVECIKKLIK